MPSLIEELENYLRYLEECGAEEIEIGADALALLDGGLEAGGREEAPGAGETLPHAKPMPPSAGDNTAGPDFMIVGETEPDSSGGKYGELLYKMIAAMGYDAKSVPLANICGGAGKSRTPPTREQMRASMPELKKKIAAINPKVIVVMGETAALGMAGNGNISAIHGRWFVFDGRPMLPTYHPQYLMKFPAVKRDAWSDLKKVLQKLGKEIPGAKK